MAIHSASPPQATNERVFAPETNSSPSAAPPTSAGQVSTPGGPIMPIMPIMPSMPTSAYKSRNWTRRLRNALLGALPASILGLTVLALWQVLVQTNTVLTLFLPAPADVARSFWFALTDPAGSLLSATTNTLIESLLGCALGALVALPLGYGIARSRIIAGSFQPYIAASQALPAVAIAPLFALWLGYDLTPVIVLCALIVFFPMVITTTLGMRLLDKDILDAARVDGANRWELLRRIELPLALPSVLAGLRTSLTLSITGAVVGEFVVGGNGLGELLLIDRQNTDSAGEFATLLTLALLAAILYGVMRLIERRFSFVEAPSL